MYVVNCISSHAYALSVEVFQWIKHPIRYLAGWSHPPIIFTTGLDSNTTHELRQEVSPGNLHYQSIFNGLVAFAYGREVIYLNDKLKIVCVILYIFGVVVQL